MVAIMKLNSEQKILICQTLKDLGADLPLSDIRKGVIKVMGDIDYTTVKYYYFKVFRHKWLEELARQNNYMSKCRAEFEQVQLRDNSEYEAEKLYNLFTGAETFI